ncbi:hypothetical protein [Pectobacterium phage Wc4-1]|uniref:Uncharacterized protein n=1 Tax=Pectobacterium phage Wc4 TaxID=2652428 RepID=A0A5P8D4C9_9CAUD|nr:hypothetical protein [Pectobacterium phage Wc4]QFP93998.1 hypothetical protein [Pectobacterium phage Wc4-1]
MAYEVNTTVYDDARYTLTPVQFRDKYIYQAILRAFAVEVQALENLMNQLFGERNINTAVGVQLDNFGANLGITRYPLQGDESYRTRLFAELFTRRSRGTAQYVMDSMKKLYNSPIAMIFEHNANLTGGVVVRVNQPIRQDSYTSVLKRMAPVAIQSVAILRDPTQTGVAWTPVEVVQDTNALVTASDEWITTEGNFGIVIQQGSGSVTKNTIGTLGEPGFLTTRLGLDTRVNNDAENVLALDAFGVSKEVYLNVQKEMPVGGIYGVMAEVSQLRRGRTTIEGEK